MKNKTAIRIFCIWAAFAAATHAANRPISKKWDVRNGTGRRMPIQWFAGESVAFDLQPVVGRNAFDLSGATLLFEVTDWDATNAYLSATGSVSGTTASWLLPPQEANLPAGIYNGYAMAVTPTSQTVIAWLTVTVQWSPTSDSFALVEPWSLLYHTAIPGAIASNTTGITALAESSNQWNSAYAWGDHADGGYLTHYTETDPAWNSGTGAIHSAIALKQDAASAATDAELAATSILLTDAVALKFDTSATNAFATAAQGALADTAVQNYDLLLSIRLAADRPSGKSVSITVGGATTWYDNFPDAVLGLVNDSVMLVWENQYISGRLLVSKSTVTNVLISGVSGRIDMVSDYEPTDNADAFYFSVQNLTIKKLNLIHHMDNMACLYFGYCFYARNGVHVDDCGIYMTGNYKHADGGNGYRTLVVVDNSGTAEIVNCTVGVITGEDSFAHIAAFHGAVSGAVCSNITFFTSGSTGGIIGDLSGDMEFVDCVANITMTPSIGSIGIADDVAVQSACAPSLLSLWVDELVKPSAFQLGNNYSVISCGISGNVGRKATARVVGSDGSATYIVYSGTYADIAHVEATQIAEIESGTYAGVYEITGTSVATTDSPLAGAVAGDTVVTLDNVVAAGTEMSVGVRQGRVFCRAEALNSYWYAQVIVDHVAFGSAGAYGSGRSAYSIHKSQANVLVDTSAWIYQRSGYSDIATFPKGECLYFVITDPHTAQSLNSSSVRCAVSIVQIDSGVLKAIEAVEAIE